MTSRVGPIILGVDPGSHITGYGVIQVLPTHHAYLCSGCIRLKGETLPERLHQLQEGLCEIITTYRPEEVAIEQVFFSKNPNTALKLGHARGVAIVTSASYQLQVIEYSVRQIKKAVVGYGAAKKDQIQHMVQVLLSLSSKPQVDAADALAVAICHANSRISESRGPVIPRKIT